MNESKKKYKYVISSLASKGRIPSNTQPMAITPKLTACAVLRIYQLQVKPSRMTNEQQNETRWRENEASRLGVHRNPWQSLKNLQPAQFQGQVDSK
jgi:hypothetical protein